MNFRSHSRAALAATMIGALALGGCVTDPETGNKRISKAAIGGVGGALGGYLLGDLLGGRNDRTEKIVGAGIGAIAGAGVGAYMDAQEKKLREQTAGTGVDVVRQGDELLLRMPSGITFATNQSSIQPQFQTTLDQVAARAERGELSLQPWRRLGAHGDHGLWRDPPDREQRDDRRQGAEPPRRDQDCAGC
jgi:uncharacterized membrane protein YebE (DUF533 family)